MKLGACAGAAVSFADGPSSDIRGLRFQLRLTMDIQ